MPAKSLRSPLVFLMTLNFINFLGFAGWSVLFNNFSKEAAGFSGYEVGIIQSIREIPGFLAFTAVAWFAIMREQTFALLALLVLALGCLVTGYFPTLAGILITTTIMSVGFHYSETANQSLGLQLFDKREAPKMMGKVASAGAAASIIAFAFMGAMWWAGIASYQALYAILGVVAIALTLAAMAWFPRIEGAVPQRKTLVLKSRYWLFYALNLMSGARRQVFTAFAGFLLVERFGFKVPEIAMLMLVTACLTTALAPVFGAMIGRIGERRSIMLENVVLIAVFVGYAVVVDGRIAAALFVIDGLFMTLMIAQRTYFQKIGDPADMAPTAAVSFTINHIAAVFIPFGFGLLWAKNPAMVFEAGAAIATVSLALAFLVPRDPGEGRETIFSGGGRAGAPQAGPA